MNTFELIDIAFTALEQRKYSPRGAATADKSHVIAAQPEASPHADLGTAEVGDSNYDGAMYCSYGHRTKAHCNCRPSADSE